MLPQDCSVLQTCISEYFTEANATDGNQAYAQYLSSAPSISDPTVFQQCGETRNYFGFDDTFLNDNAICEDVYQMRYSRSFDFLEDFFGDSGSSTAQTGSGDGTGELVPLVLTPIDRSKCNSLRFADADFGQWSQYSQFPCSVCCVTAASTTKPVLNGQAWRSTNFALSQIATIYDNFLAAIAAMKCPGEPTGTLQTICSVVTKLMWSVFKIISIVWKMVRV